MAWIKYANIDKGLILSLPVSSIFRRNFSRKSTEKSMTVKEISKPRLLVRPCKWSSTLMLMLRPIFDVFQYYVLIPIGPIGLIISDFRSKKLV